MRPGSQKNLLWQKAAPRAPRQRPGRSKKKVWNHFSIYACHPCAGAMLIFSVSFQFYHLSEDSKGSSAILDKVLLYNALTKVGGAGRTALLSHGGVFRNAGNSNVIWAPGLLFIPQIELASKAPDGRATATQAVGGLAKAMLAADTP